MSDDLPAPRRPPPAPTNRKTKDGADQFVLACNARVEASDYAFDRLLVIEDEVDTQRDELDWAAHGSKRTGKWVTGRVLVLAYILVGSAAVYGWAFTHNGKLFRVGLVQSYFSHMAGDPWTTTHGLTSDLTPAEITALVAEYNAAGAPKAPTPK